MLYILCKKIIIHQNEKLLFFKVYLENKKASHRLEEKKMQYIYLQRIYGGNMWRHLQINTMDKYQGKNWVGTLQKKIWEEPV